MRLRSIVILLFMVGACSSPTAEDDGNGDTCSVTPYPYDDALTQRGAVRDVHDPVVIKDEGAYTLFSTGHGIPIRRSANLIDWQPAGQVFSQMPSWVDETINNVEFPWAPDISFFNGRYHLYYSVSTFGSQRSAIGLATSENLTSWVDQGPVLQSRPGIDAFNAIDANVVLDASGTPWLSWGSYWTGIYMQRIDPSTGMLSEDDDALHHIASRPIVSAIEAPFIVRRGDFYYLFVSWDQCCQGVQSSYKVMVGRSESITGPYVDQSGTDMVQGGGTLVLETYSRFRGPGHQAVHVEDGRYYLFHHFYDAMNSGVPTLQIRPLMWLDEWPVAGPPYAADGDFAASGAQPDVTGTWAHSVDGGTPYGIELETGGAIDLCNADGSWSLEGSTLSLQWEHGTEHVVVSSDRESYTGRAEDGSIVRGWRPAVVLDKTSN